MKKKLLIGTKGISAIQELSNSNIKVINNDKLEQITGGQAVVVRSLMVNVVLGNYTPPANPLIVDLIFGNI